MKQILQSYKSGELWLAEVPTPACSRGGAVVRTTTSFVSAGTERMLVDFAKKNIIGKAFAMPDQVKKVIRKMQSEGIFATIEKVQAKLDQPIPLGYSCAGVIEEAGVECGGLSVGDRVACAGAGYANHAEFNYVPKNLLVKIPDSVSFEDASCATVGSIALQGVRQCDVRVGEVVCVMGLGLLGLIAVQILKASGTIVIGFDPNEARCAQAREFGAAVAVSSNLVSACMEKTNGRGVDAVLIMAATQSNEPVTQAGEICRHRGKVVVTGMVGMDIPRDNYYKKELDFMLSLSYGPGRYDTQYEEKGVDYPFGYVRWTEQRNIESFLALVEQGLVTPSRLITHRFRIDDALSAYELLLGKTKEPYLGIVINYEATDKAEKKNEKTLIVREYLPNKNDISIGFIGAGNFAKAVLLPEIKKTGAALKYICTASGMSAEQTAKKHGFSIATTDSDTLLKDNDINTIFIATRHNSHAAYVIKSLSAGKNVFVEKPLCVTREEMADLKKAVADTRGMLMVGFNRRFSPHAKLLSDYFKNRRTPMMLNYRINAGNIPVDHWIQDINIGGGRIIGEGCHFVDFASSIIGSKAISVYATSLSTAEDSRKPEDSVAFAIKYADGSVANIQYIANGSSDFSKENCELFADGSTAIMDDFKKTVCAGKLGKKSISGKQAKGFSEEIEAFFRAITNGKAAPININSIFETTDITFSVIESLRSGKRVDLA
jgi:predicted dehydrogenase